MAELGAEFLFQSSEVPRTVYLCQSTCFRPRALALAIEGPLAISW